MSMSLWKVSRRHNGLMDTRDSLSSQQKVCLLRSLSITCGARDIDATGIAYLSSNTARKHHDLLSAVSKVAVKQGILLSNPAERVEAPKPHPPEIHYCSLEGLQRLLTLSSNFEYTFL